MWVVHTLHKRTVYTCTLLTNCTTANTSSYSLMSPQQRTEESGKYVLLHAQYSVHGPIIIYSLALHWALSTRCTSECLIWGYHCVTNNILYTWHTFLTARVPWHCQLVQRPIWGLSWHCDVCPFNWKVSGGPRHACCAHHRRHHCRHHENLLPVSNPCKFNSTCMASFPSRSSVCSTWFYST